MKRIKALWLLAVLVGLALAPVAAQRPEQRGVVPVPDYGYPYEASIWVGKSIYNVGDNIRVNFTVSEDAYVYIFSSDPTGRDRQIFPNYYDRNNFVRGGTTRSLPDGSYRLQVTGPRGYNTLTLIAVRRNYPFLRDWAGFTQSNPYPDARGGVGAIRAQLQRHGSSPSQRGVVPGPPLNIDTEIAEATASFMVRDSGGWGGGSTGRLKVLTRPRDVDVYLDGRRLGDTPVNEPVRAGQYTLRLERSGYWTYERRIEIRAGRETEVALDLKSLN